MSQEIHPLDGASLGALTSVTKMEVGLLEAINSLRTTATTAKDEGILAYFPSVAAGHPLADAVNFPGEGCEAFLGIMVCVATTCALC